MFVKFLHLLTLARNFDVKIVKICRSGPVQSWSHCSFGIFTCTYQITLVGFLYKYHVVAYGLCLKQRKICSLLSRDRSVSNVRPSVVRLVRPTPHLHFSCCCRGGVVTDNLSVLPTLFISFLSRNGQIFSFSYIMT